MKKLLAAALALLLAAAPALAARDETVYATLAPDGAPARVEAVVRSDTPVEGLSLLSLAGEHGYYLLETQAPLPWAVSVSESLARGEAGECVISIDVAPNPACEISWFSDSLALQMSVTVDLDNNALLACPGATVLVAGSSATLSYMALGGGEIHAQITVATEDFRMGEIQIAAMRMDVSALGGAYGADALTEAGRQLTGGMGQLTDGLSGFEVTSQQKMQMAVIAAMKSEDANLILAQSVINQLLPALERLDEFQQGMAQLSDGLEQYVSGVNGLAETLFADAGEAASFAGIGEVDSVQFILRVPAQAEEAEPPREEAPEAQKTFWQRLLALFGA